MFPAVKKQLEKSSKAAVQNAGLAVVFGSLAIMSSVVLPGGGWVFAATLLNGFAATMYGMSARQHYLTAKAANRFTELSQKEVISQSDELEMKSALERVFGTESKIINSSTSKVSRKSEIPRSGRDVAFRSEVSTTVDDEPSSCHHNTDVPPSGRQIGVLGEYRSAPAPQSSATSTQEEDNSDVAPVSTPSSPRPSTRRP